MALGAAIAHWLQLTTWPALAQRVGSALTRALDTIDGYLTTPEVYDKALAAMKKMLDAHLQPSLDAWLRVHAAGHQYALYFRDIRREIE